MMLVLELDTDEPVPYFLIPIRTASFGGRADVLVCSCDPILAFSAATLGREKGIASKFVGICSRVGVGVVLSEVQGVHPVNVVSIDASDQDADLTSANTVFAAVGFVKAA